MTAIFGKLGVAQIRSDFAPLFRPAVILAVIAGMALAGGQWQPLTAVLGRTYLSLALPGANWLGFA